MPYKDPEKKKEYYAKYRDKHRNQDRTRDRDRIAANPKKYAAKNLSWNIRNPEKNMLRIARSRAKRKEIEFSIDLEDVIIPDVCPLLGIPLESNLGKGRMGPSSPSLDRIDPTRGYVKGNVWVISYRANAIKHNATLEELEKLTTNLRQKLAIHS